MERKTSACKICGGEIITVEYMGKKEAVDAHPKQGFVFIEDEYGEPIGSVEMAAIHEPHKAHCGDAIGTEDGKTIIGQCFEDGTHIGICKAKTEAADDDLADNLPCFTEKCQFIDWGNKRCTKKKVGASCTYQTRS